MKKIPMMIARGVVLLLIKIVEMVHRMLRWVYRRLSGGFDEATATIKEIEQEYGISHRQAYKIWKKHHMTELEKARLEAKKKREDMRSLSSDSSFGKFRFGVGTDGTLELKRMER
jgi:predicted DNA-binding ArsR family transcriptional regulator